LQQAKISQSRSTYVFGVKGHMGLLPVDLSSGSARLLYHRKRSGIALRIARRGFDEHWKLTAQGALRCNTWRVTVPVSKWAESLETIIRSIGIWDTTSSSETGAGVFSKFGRVAAFATGWRALKYEADWNGSVNLDAVPIRQQ